MLRPKTLRQRLIFFLLVPLALLMLAMGTVAFIYATVTMFKEWREAAILRLARTAHFIDMNLSQSKRLVLMYHEAAEASNSREVPEWLLERLKSTEGIERVDLIWSASNQTDGEEPTAEAEDHDELQEHSAEPEPHHVEPPASSGSRGQHHGEVLPSRFGLATGHQTVTLISEMKDRDKKTIGKLEVVIRFDHLLEGIDTFGWQVTDKAYLVDRTGRVLTCTTGKHDKARLDASPIELATVRAMKDNRSGTVLSGGFPPREVSGFFRLREAPWSLVIIAPGREILAPIIRFALLFLIVGSAFIVLVLVLIQMTTAPSVEMIRAVSSAAGRVARGDYNNLPAASTQDEVGQLVKSFNSMVLQLEERMRLKEAMHVAMEVQQSLLPRRAPEVSGLDIAGQSIYCEETGGDYYDFFQLPGMGKNTVGFAVGDVVGHGIGAALLMTTVRALLHSKAAEAGELSRMITDVNRLLCRDTDETGSFATLFFMAIDPDARTIRWVRAGHDPALIYTPSTETVEELRGEGMALGIDEDAEYPEYTWSRWSAGQVVVIGTDGIWETENTAGEAFGKTRLREIIRQHAHLTASATLEAVMRTLKTFRDTAAQTDDATMVVVKVLDAC